MLQDVNTSITLDLKNPSQYIVVHAMQGDKNSRLVTIELTLDGDPYTIPSNIEARLMGHRADNKPILEDCTISGNKITCELTEYILGASGLAECKIGLYDNSTEKNKLLSSISFILKINKNPFDEKAVIGTPEFSVLTNVLNKIEPTIAKVEDLNQSVTVFISEWEPLKADLDNKTTDLGNTLDTAHGIVEDLNQSITDFQAAENIRISNENERIENEKNRQSSVSSMLTTGQDKIDAISSSIEQANDVIAETNEAKENAVKATDDALNAKELADTATSNANNAATLATTAADSANQATEAAISATEGATNATSETNTVITNAVEATNRANQAADDIQDLLDGKGQVTSQEKANWNDAAIKAHVHENKDTLDSISSEDISKWNSGIFKPDGVTIFVDENNVLSGAKAIKYVTQEEYDAMTIDEIDPELTYVTPQDDNDAINYAEIITEFNTIKSSIDTLNTFKDSFADVSEINESISKINEIQNSITTINTELAKINELQNSITTINTELAKISELQDSITTMNDKLTLATYYKDNQINESKTN